MYRQKPGRPHPEQSTQFAPRPKKHLGQNFLNDASALAKIVNAANLSPTDFVVEIGPGLGVLTKELVKKTARVKAVELDESLIPILTRNLQQTNGPAPANLEIIHGDALTFPLPAEPYKLVANIPYYITSPILNHFLQPETAQQKRPDLIVLLVQKEVAEKVCATPGDHTVLSLQVQIFGKPEIMGIVGKNSFNPPPKVDSAILRVTPYPEPLIQDTALFFKIIHTAFSQRRKTLLNSLGNFFKLDNGQKLPKEKIAALLEKAGIKPLARPQELTVADWQKLIENLPQSRVLLSK